MADLASYLGRSAAFLALFYALYWLILKRETFFAVNRAYLLAAAALSLVLPLLRVPSPFFETVVYARPLPELTAAASAAAPSQGAGPLDVLLVIYAAGAALFLLLFILRVGRLALLVRRCGCVRQRGLRIVLCGSPGESFSFFNFVFLNRSKVPGGDMDRVLTHELAHVRKLHSLDVVLTELLSVVQWFNPFVWPYKRSLRETHEYLADRAVIAQGGGLARYQLLIVEQHVGGKLLELASSFRTSQIKRRIVMMSKQETKGLARWKPLLILPLALALVLAFAESRTVVKGGPAAVAAQEQKTPPPGQEKSEEEIIKAWKDKVAQLEEMKKKNEETMLKLEAKLKEAPDAATREQIQGAMKDQKIIALQISAKQCLLQMDKVEYQLNKETDPAKKAELEHKLQQLHLKADECMKAVEAAGGKAPVVMKKTVEKK